MQSIKFALYGISFFIAVFVIHFAMQNHAIYNVTLGIWVDNYSNINGEIIQEKTPYVSISDENLLHWDAAIFNQIKDNYYDQNKAGSSYIFASFPLFPLLWKLSHLPPFGILILNFLLYLISVGILIFLFKDNLPNLNTSAYLIFLLCLPTIVPFLIPYSEAVFMFFFTLAVAGHIRNNYILYFTGLSLASSSRAAAIIILISFIATELYFFAYHKSIVSFLKNLALKTSPILAGTLIASLFQAITGDGHLLSFMDAQKYWGNEFTVPHNISDWSHESFSLNIALIFCFIAPVSIFILHKFFSVLFNYSLGAAINYNYKADKVEYLQILSSIYFTGIFFFIIFFRNGCIYGIYRYVAATPFFYLFIITARKNLLNFLSEKILISFAGILIFLGIFFLGLVPYSTNWNFSDAGFFILISAGLAWLFIDKLPTGIAKIFAAIYFFICAVWCSYLLNMFLSNAWIST